MKTRRNAITGIAAAVCILSLTFPNMAYADEVGPGVTPLPIQTGQETGPGISPETPDTSTNPPTSQLREDSSNYYLQPLSSPIVPELEKYSYDQMSTDINALQQRYGSHMSVTSIGRTPDNREIYDIVVGNQNASRHLLIQAGIHGREYITSQLLMKQLEYTLAFYESGTYNGSSLSSMLDQVAVHFVPMTNPDGISISQWGEAGIGSEELKQGLRASYETDFSKGRTSKSYENYLRIWKANAKGVDLNRNFDADWNGRSDDTNHPSYSGYKGVNPLSEPETSALANLILNKPFKAVINYHAMGQIIYWDTAQNMQKDTSYRLAQILSQATGYRLDNSLGRLGAKDWLQSKQPPITSVTLEVGKTACPVPISEFGEIWNQNRSAVARGVEFVIANN